MLQIGDVMLQDGIVLVGRMICLGILVGLSVADVRSRKVPVALLLTGGVLATVYILLFARELWIIHVLGLLTGAGFILVSKVTREGIGYGDSMLLCILGIYLGIWKLLELLLVAWLLVLPAAMFLLIRKHYTKKARLPMIPFITAGYLVMWISELLGG